MKRFRRLKPWQRWGLLFGCTYLALSLATFLLLDALGIQGEGWGVFKVFLTPSLLLARIIPSDIGPWVNALFFLIIIFMNAMFYWTIGALAGTVFGRNPK